MNQIKKIRVGLGVTRKKLAEKVGCTPGAIGHYESGRRTPDLAVSRTIIAALGELGAEITLDEVFPPPERE
ncbi:helix-turn-helix transcriptional regulator [Xenorhabdus stockiae]|uniref:helix-turn-helix transcriptional regulator n=1 Tax=Xenorhabdus stockiae TaxID=351614 RepID=UPI003CEDD7BD